MAAQLTEASRELKQHWMSKVKGTFENGPLVKNTVFGLFLVGLEKIVELEFACPCIPNFNWLFVAAYFLLPALLASLLMWTTQGRSCKCKMKDVFYCLLPAIGWCILLLMDGQYLVCAITYWSGRYVTVDKAAPDKWCEPVNATSQMVQERMIVSQRWYSLSQGIGIGIVLIIIMVVGVYMCCNKGEPRDEDIEISPISPP